MSTFFKPRARFFRMNPYWLLLGPEVELRHTPYDLAEAAERIGCTDYPRARDFAARYVLQRPSEESMLEVFSRAELG